MSPAPRSCLKIAWSKKRGVPQGDLRWKNKALVHHFNLIENMGKMIIEILEIYETDQERFDCAL